MPEDVVPAVLQALSGPYPDCFVQYTHVKQINALELVADRSPQAAAAVVDLLQRQRLEVALPGSTSFLEVSQAPGVPPPGVQILQTTEVPSYYRREGFFSALLGECGYDPAILIAEGLGSLSAKLQAIYPGMGNGSVCMAYVKAPEGDFGLSRLPKVFKIDGSTVFMKCNLAPGPGYGSLLPSFLPAGLGSLAARTRGSPPNTRGTRQTPAQSPPPSSPPLVYGPSQF